MIFLRKMNHLCQTCFINGIFLYSNIVFSIKEWYNHHYYKNAHFKQIIDYVSSIYVSILQCKKENTNNEWMCLAWIDVFANPDESVDCKLREKYTLFENIDFKSLKHENEILDYLKDNFSKICNSLYLSNMNVVSHHNSIITKVMTPENETIYICKRLLNACIDQHDDLSRSFTKFVSIEYSHPKMDHKIDLPINREWLITGNELFTPTHILHLLKSLNESYVFDFDYKIHVMDYNINMFEFSSEKYLYIGKHNYELL